MPQPTIDLTEVANGVTAILNARVHGAQLASAQAEAQREAEAQSRIAEATEAARVQRETALRELSILANKEREVKQLLETKSQQHGVMGKELQSLFRQHNFLLMQLHQMKKQLGL